MLDKELAKWVNTVALAEKKAHFILAQHESSKSRVILLEDLTKKLSGSPVDVQDYFIEAIKCLEIGVCRSAIVFSWAGHFHVLSEELFKKHEADIRYKRQNWKFSDLIELKENYPESQILDVAKEVTFINKADLKILQGQLSKRNQCAHPTLYRPSLNNAIGFVDEMISQTMDYMNMK
ncbi:MAG: hypothetical protein GC192_06940 [Bacteroidetes bacterium]|nr:hypothetical protein [Bacteroidota bacterium]